MRESRRIKEKKMRVREKVPGRPLRKSGNLTGCLKKLFGCKLMISVSAKVLYQVTEKSEEMKIEKVATL